MSKCLVALLEPPLRYHDPVERLDATEFAALKPPRLKAGDRVKFVSPAIASFRCGCFWLETLRSALVGLRFGFENSRGNECRLLNTAPFIGSYMLMSDTRRSQSQPRFEYLGCAAGFQETRDVRKRVLRRPHYGRLAVRVLR